jgi:hypothetical protein
MPHHRIPVPSGGQLAIGATARWLVVLGACIAASCSDVQVVAVEIAAMELVPASASILVGEAVQLEARLLDGSGSTLSGREIEWSSSDPVDVPVDGNGLVRGFAAGTATITAASAGSKATAEVVVNRPAPELTSVQPSRGQRLEILELVLTGANFQAGVTTVAMGEGITLDAVSVTAPETITVCITIGADADLGARNVSVTNPAPGGGTATLTDGFTVLAEHPTPTLTQVSPSAGQRQDVLDVTLSGTGFVPDLTTVSFGSGVAVAGVLVESPTKLVATISIAAGTSLGAREVSVTNPAPGGGTATLESGFTILPEHPAPTLASADPDEVQRRDTRDVTLTGSGFIQDITTVTFGPDITVNDIQVSGSTSLTANIRIGAGASLGSRDVSVTNPAPGGGTGTLTAGFTVLEENPAPTVSAVSPETGRRGVVMTVFVSGSGFVQGLTSVSFGEGVTVNAVNVHLWTSLSVNITIAADAQPGPRDVAVTNAPPGGGTFIIHDAFRILPAEGN